MNDAQVGSVFRAVRIRRGQTQALVAESAGVSRAVVSMLERGSLEATSLRLVRRVAGALGVSVALEPHWRGAELAKLLDENHAVMVRAVVARLTAAGWEAVPERTFNVWGEKGSVDVLAWNPDYAALLTVEVKTRLADMQDLLSTIDRKRRLAPTLARNFNWKPRLVGTVLVFPGETWARNAVARFEPLFAATLPKRTIEVRRWLKRPAGDMGGIWFLLNDIPGGANQRRRASMRVRPRKSVPRSPMPRSAAGG
jgi:transcriptional regulator with XRE-family HTH domain